MSATQEIREIPREEMLSALFAQLVIQQTNMAMMLLGRIANPQTGEIMHDHEAAGFFIDQLDMLEAKTRGNLSQEEEQLLKQNLMGLRLAYVEATNQSATPESPKEIPKDAAKESPAKPEDHAAPTEESGKKFTKKY